MNSKNVLKALAVKDLEAAVDFNCKIWVKLLTRLEYVKELRAKGCRIDDGCIEDLNKIATLELLHVKNTGVTIDGLLQLNGLVNLKKIFFSADDVESITEKLLQLKIILPHCDLVIDSIPYYFNAIGLFLSAVKKKGCTYRLKIKNELLDAPWSTWLGHPSDTCIESEAQGLYSIKDIEWVEINPIEKRAAGRLVPEKEIDHSQEIATLLDYLAFSFMITEGIISVYLVKNKL